MVEVKPKMQASMYEQETAANVFNCRQNCSLSTHVVALLNECKDIIMKKLMKSRDEEHSKTQRVFSGNAEEECAKVLFPLIIRQSCLMLSKTEMLIVFSEHNKAKSEILADEVKKISIHCKVLAAALYAFASGYNNN